MIKLFLTIIFGVIMGIANIVTTPINALINQFFPDLSNTLSNVISIFDTNIFPLIGWFFNLIPEPILFSLLTYFNLHLTICWYFDPLYESAIRGLKLIKKLPFM